MSLPCSFMSLACLCKTRSLGWSPSPSPQAGRGNTTVPHPQKRPPCMDTVSTPLHGPPRRRTGISHTHKHTRIHFVHLNLKESRFALFFLKCCEVQHTCKNANKCPLAGFLLTEHTVQSPSKWEANEGRPLKPSYSLFPLFFPGITPWVCQCRSPVPIFVLYINGSI